MMPEFQQVFRERVFRGRASAGRANPRRKPQQGTHLNANWHYILNRPKPQGREARLRCPKPRRNPTFFPDLEENAVKTLLDEQSVKQGVERLAAEIARAYGERPVTIIAVMTGSIVLMADLIRLLDMPLRVGVVQASSYKGGTRRGNLTINAEMMPDIFDREVLLVDDIFDTGHTLQEVVKLMHAMGPKSIKTAVLLAKQGRTEVAMRPDFTAFEIPDEFVVGYGLDYQDHYRNLREIAVLEAADLAAYESTSRQEP
jgi:hypoxanthine phosphoribosyltransferase